MRPIVLTILAAHEKMAKWLVPEFEAMRPSEGLYVKNTFKFVSFNVEALFPSILVDKSLELLKKCLEKQHLNLDVLT
jgi:hypothetical protein